jgi:hypothetical protein
VALTLLAQSPIPLTAQIHEIMWLNLVHSNNECLVKTAGMQTPGGFYEGAGMTGMAGMGGLETVGGAYGYGAQGAGYGGQGSMFGQQAAGMGGMYEQMATDPMSMQAYMSPYMQNVVEIQKQQQ